MRQTVDKHYGLAQAESHRGISSTINVTNFRLSPSPIANPRWSSKSEVVQKAASPAHSEELSRGDDDDDALFFSLDSLSAPSSSEQSCSESSRGTSPAARSSSEQSPSPHDRTPDQASPRDETPDQASPSPSPERPPDPPSANDDPQYNLELEDLRSHVACLLIMHTQQFHTHEATVCSVKTAVDHGFGKRWPLLLKEWPKWKETKFASYDCLAVFSGLGKNFKPKLHDCCVNGCIASTGR